MGKLIDDLLAEWAVIRAAPRSFAVVIAILAVGIWCAISWAKDSQIDILKAQLAAAEKQPRVAAMRDDSYLYQNGIAVAVVGQAIPDTAMGMVHFAGLTANRTLDTASEFEFRNWKLVCNGKVGHSMTFGAAQQIAYYDFKCRILGPR